MFRFVGFCGYFVDFRVFQLVLVVLEGCRRFSIFLFLGFRGMSIAPPLEPPLDRRLSER